MQSTSDINVHIEAAYHLYLNGSKAEAARKVRGLSKLGIVRMLTEYHNLQGGMDIIMNPATKYDFEKFVYRALEGGV